MYRSLHSLLIVTFLTTSLITAQSPVHKVYDHATNGWHWLTYKAPKKPALVDLHITSFVPTQDASLPALSINAWCRQLSKHATFPSNNQTIQGIAYRVFSHIPKLPDNATIYIYSNGYAGFCSNARYKQGGAGAYIAYLQLKASLIDGPCITFDYPTDTRQSFNCGQTLDQYCLAHVIKAVRKKNPTAKIVLVGFCRGALTIINYLRTLTQKQYTQYHIAGIILESPPLSLEKAAQQVGRSYVGNITGLALKNIIPYVYPSYNQTSKIVLEDPPHVPAQIPLFIGALAHDKIASYKDIQRLHRVLKKAGCTVAPLFTSYDTTLSHGKLGIDKEYKEALRTFVDTQKLN